MSSENAAETLTSPLGSKDSIRYPTIVVLVVQNVTLFVSIVTSVTFFIIIGPDTILKSHTLSRTNIVFFVAVNHTAVVEFLAFLI
jgi:hypothetical protein